MEEIYDRMLGQEEQLQIEAVKYLEENSGQDYEELKSGLEEQLGEDISTSKMQAVMRGLRFNGFVTVSSTLEGGRTYELNSESGNIEIEELLEAAS